MTPPAPPPAEPSARYTFVLKTRDRPGTLELIAATFAHRGVSLSATVGCDASFDPDGRASLTLHFCASERRKEALRQALLRLPRVLRVSEVAAASVQAVALVRVAPDADLPAGDLAVFPLPRAGGDPSFRLIGSPEAVEAAIAAWRNAEKLRGVAYGVLALD